MTVRVKDPGIGSSSVATAKRFVNQDGSFNIKHVNRHKKLADTYSYLINISWSRFFLYVFVGYIFSNTFFALVYLIIGIETIDASTGSLLHDFFKAFFFSAQTMTTVGYGAMAPRGIVVGIISSFEAMMGLLSFSFITGLLYGRFSQPKANIRFSNTIVVREHQGNNALMFRLMSNSYSTMINPKIEVTLALAKEQDGEFVNSFFRLKLERDHITYLPTTWTIVHSIDQDSPLYYCSKEQLNHLKGELLIMVSYYDESFSQEVHQMHSYELKNLQVDHKFERAFHYDDDGYTLLDHDKLDKTHKI